MDDNIQLFNDLIHKCYKQVNQLLDFAQRGDYQGKKIKQSIKLLKKINAVAHGLKRINNLAWYFKSTKKFRKKLEPYQEQLQKIQIEIDVLVGE